MITIEASQVEHLIDWGELCDHLAAGHARATAQIKDSVLSRDGDSLLVRSAWIDGLGMAVKVATVFPGNAAHHKSHGTRQSDSLSRSNRRARGVGRL